MRTRITLTLIAILIFPVALVYIGCIVLAATIKTLFCNSLKIKRRMRMLQYENKTK